VKKAGRVPIFKGLILSEIGGGQDDSDSRIWKLFPIGVDVAFLGMKSAEGTEEGEEGDTGGRKRGGGGDGRKGEETDVKWRTRRRTRRNGKILVRSLFDLPRSRTSVLSLQHAW
jgi:hypothetical protein